MPIRKFGLVADALKSTARLDLREPTPVDDTHLRRVHTIEYIEAIRTGEPRALAESQKFPWSAALFDSVKLTSGGCLAAAGAALDSGIAAALVSGFHHAHADHGEGFCTFNGLVIAVDALRAAGRIKSAAVLDLDLHYGNGTASLAVARPYLRAVSVYGNDYRDNCAYKDVTARRHEDGQNHVSYALPERCTLAQMMPILESALEALLSAGNPDLLLFQAGADPYFEDPYSPLALDHEDLKARDRRVFNFARTHRIPIAWVLAGGYTPDVSKVVQVHVNTFEAAIEIYA